jgi:heme O synthase-like polyprenyltransferase
MKLFGFSIAYLTMVFVAMASMQSPIPGDPWRQRHP